MTSCSTKVISDLSEHLDRAAHLPHAPAANTKPTASNASWALPLAPSFRIPAQNDAASALDRDLNAFARPASQIDPLPPFATPRPSWIGGAAPGGRSALSYEYELLSEPDDFESSAYWNPEQERLHALSSFASSSHASSSTSSFHSFSTSSSSFPSSTTSSTASSSYSSAVPTDDEAASISSTPPVPHPTDPSSSSDSQPSTSAHPLTLSPPPHAQWNFERLFSRRRKWFGGVRVPSESFLVEPTFDEASTTDYNTKNNPTESASRGTGASAAHSMLGRQTRQQRERSVERQATGRTLQSRSASTSRLCQEYSEIGSGGGGEEEAARERARIACEVLRASAMERLRLVSAHLDWTG